MSSWVFLSEYLAGMPPYAAIVVHGMLYLHIVLFLLLLGLLVRDRIRNTNKGDTDTSDEKDSLIQESDATKTDQTNLMELHDKPKEE